MKRILLFLTLIFTIGTNPLFAQNNDKISPDLRTAMEQSTSTQDLFRIVVLMNEQYDATTFAKQTRGLNKAQKREFVINELQRISTEGQKSLLKDLHQGQKARLVDDIQSFWIFNGLCCSATKAMVHAIAERPDVAYVTEEGYIQVPEVEDVEEMPEEKATNQWNVTKVNAPDVWNLGYTGKGVIVAVIDTGVNYNHTDIKDNMWDGGEEFPNHGWDFINNDNDPMDDGGHGTHCAGTVSSYGTNGKQCGIAKDAKIMALKSLGPNGGNQAYTWSAMEFAISHGADILSMSLGADGIGGDADDRIAMENVLHCGVVASVSAGNVGNKYENGQLQYPVPYNVGSPGTCPSPWHHPDQIAEGGHSAVVTVGATTSNDTRSSFSSFGPSTWTVGDNIGHYYDYPWVGNDPVNIGLIKPDIAAPGSSVVSLDYASSNTGYATKNGTSMAAPCVAGVMALMLEANPTLTPVEIDSIIETTAVACEGQTSKNNYYGSGRIDALAAINYMLNVCAAPTDLIASVNGFDVALSWTAAANVSTYSVYRNGAIIASTVSGTTYTDENAPAGDNTYFVRSNGVNHQASLPSNQVTVTVSARHTPVKLRATDINTDNQTIALDWNKLSYTNIGTYYLSFGEDIIAAQRFPVDLLQPYAGMQIEHFYFSLRDSGSSCTIGIYEGDDLDPGTLIHEETYTTTEDHESIDYVFPTPITINPNKVLWVTVATSGALLMDGRYEGKNSNDAFYHRFPRYDFWYSFPYNAWSFQLGLSDGNDYQYKLYRNGTDVASNLTTPSVTTTYSNGLNRYQVAAYTNGYESSLSNSIFVVDGNAQTSQLSLEEDDYLYGLSGSQLTVSGTLSNGNVEHLILEDGAQLVNSSEGVKATVKKAITPYTEGEKDGWHLIASPMTESLEASEVAKLLSNDYDLYTFDQSQDQEWRNYEAQAFDISNKTGYLYANSANTTLTFSGTLAGAVEATPLAYDDQVSYKGFNLIGNPYPCETYVTGHSFYVLQDNATTHQSEFILGENPIPPCAAILVEAQNAGESVSFSKTAPDASPAPQGLTVTVSKANLRGEGLLDKARISFNKGERLTKFNKNTEGGRLYILQDGKEFAVACISNDGDAPWHVSTEVPVNFKAAENGTYTLAIEVDEMDLAYLYLIDNMTGENIDLLASRDGACTVSTAANYTFEAKTTDYASRFRLVFAPMDGPSTGSGAFAYYSDGEIRFVETCHGASLQIVDMTGRVIRVCTDGACTVSTSEITPGVYVLRLIDGENVRTQKIVIE